MAEIELSVLQRWVLGNRTESREEMARLKAAWEKAATSVVSR